VGLARAGSEPHPLFVDLVEKVAPRQLELLAERREQGGERVEGWVRPLWEFWAETLPAALDTEFGDQRAVQPTLRTLLEHVRGGTPADPRSGEGYAPPRRPSTDEDDWGTAPVPPGGRGRDDDYDGPSSGEGRSYGSGRRYGDERGEAEREGRDSWGDRRDGTTGSRPGSRHEDGGDHGSSGGDREGYGRSGGSREDYGSSGGDREGTGRAAGDGYGGSGGSYGSSAGSRRRDDYVDPDLDDRRGADGQSGPRRAPWDEEEPADPRRGGTWGAEEGSGDSGRSNPWDGDAQ